MFQAAFSGYSTNQVSTSRQFYEDTLGIVTKENMGGFNFSVAGQQVFVYEKTNHEPAKYTVLNFVVNDINAAIDMLASKGVQFERYDDMPAPQDDRGVLRGKDAGMGPNIAWFKDPGGNILALVEE